MAKEASPFELPPLGIVGILKDAFALIWQRLVLFLVIALVFHVLSSAFTFIFFGLEFENIVVRTMLETLPSQIIWVTEVVFITIAVYDVRFGNPFKLGAYLTATMGYFPAALALAILVMIGSILGFLLFIVPGLYLMAMWSVVVPAIVVDQSGFGALKRSQSLTEFYRWQIVKMYLLLFLGGMVVILPLQFLIFSDPFAPTTTFLSNLLITIPYTITGVFSAVVSTTLFFRLKELNGSGYRAIADQ